MASASRIDKPLLPQKFLTDLLKRLHGQDPTFGTVILTKAFSEQRRSFLLGITNINGIAAYSNCDDLPTTDAKDTYLHGASQQGDVPLVCELLRLGAAIDIRNVDNRTPLLVACHHLALLKLNPAPGVSPARLEARAYRTRLIIRILIEQHADVNAVDATKHTPLSLLLHAMEMDLVGLVTLYGAEPAVPCQNAAGELFSFPLPSKQIPPDLRPPQLCRCFGGKFLKDCHDGPELLSYPDDRVCPCCDSSKTFGKCCQGRQIEFIETWEPGNKRLVRWKNPRSQIQKSNYEGIPSERREQVKSLVGSVGIEGLRSLDLKEGLAILSLQKRLTANSLLLQGKIDPAFAYAFIRVDFDPQPWARLLSRKESKIRQQEFNSEVDAYIDSATRRDARSRLDIERAAKIGLNGGPLYRRCEATGCGKLEGKDLQKALTCGGCKMVIYCGEDCQKRDWRGHRKVCGTLNQREQQLPSQKAVMEYVKSISGYKERVEVTDTELREKLRNKPQEFLEIPYKG